MKPKAIFPEDTTIKAGDLITAYAGGIHRVISVDKRNPKQCSMETIINKDGNLQPQTKHRFKSCGLAWCHKIDVEKKIAELENIIKLLKQ